MTEFELHALVFMEQMSEDLRAMRHRMDEKDRLKKEAAKKVEREIRMRKYDDDVINTSRRSS